MARKVTGAVVEHTGRDGRADRALRFTAYGKRRYVSRVPDAGPQTHEYLCVRYVDGEEWGLRERVDICSSYDSALREKRRLEGLRQAGEVVILRRVVGAWTDLDTIMKAGE